MCLVHQQQKKKISCICVLICCPVVVVASEFFFAVQNGGKIIYTIIDTHSVCIHLFCWMASKVNQSISINSAMTIQLHSNHQMNVFSFWKYWEKQNRKFVNFTIHFNRFAICGHRHYWAGFEDLFYFSSFFVRCVFCVVIRHKRFFALNNKLWVRVRAAGSWIYL